MSTDERPRLYGIDDWSDPPRIESQPIVKDTAKQVTLEHYLKMPWRVGRDYTKQPTLDEPVARTPLEAAELYVECRRGKVDRALAALGKARDELAKAEAFEAKVRAEGDS